MQKGRFSEMPIIGMLSEQKAKILTAQVRRRQRLMRAPFYGFKAEDGGMGVSDAGRLMVPG